MHLQAALAASISQSETVELLFYQTAEAYRTQRTLPRPSPSGQLLLAAPLLMLLLARLFARCDMDCAAFLQTFDLLGYEPSMWNKINIHIGGTYEGREETLDRFAQ